MPSHMMTNAAPHLTCDCRWSGQLGSMPIFFTQEQANLFTQQCVLAANYHKPHYHKQKHQPITHHRKNLHNSWYLSELSGAILPWISIVLCISTALWILQHTTTMETLHNSHSCTEFLEPCCRHQTQRTILSTWAGLILLGSTGQIWSGVGSQNSNMVSHL